MQKVMVGLRGQDHFDGQEIVIQGGQIIVHHPTRKTVTYVNLPEDKMVNMTQDVFYIGLVMKNKDEDLWEPVFGSVASSMEECQSKMNKMKLPENHRMVIKPMKMMIMRREG